MNYILKHSRLKFSATSNVPHFIDCRRKFSAQSHINPFCTSTSVDWEIYSEIVGQQLIQLRGASDGRYLDDLFSVKA